PGGAPSGRGRASPGDQRDGGRARGGRVPRGVSTAAPRLRRRWPGRADRGRAPLGRPHAADRANRCRAPARVEGDAMPLKFGVHIPTAIEGMMSPVPFARPSDILPTALLCEELGYDSVWGNDHMTTQRYVQREFAEAPNFFEPLI